VLSRPDGDPARSTTVAPGAFRFAVAPDVHATRRLPNPEAGVPDRQPGDAGRETPAADAYQVVWWDPHVLALDAGPPFGLRRDDLIARDGDAEGSARGLARYRAWEAARAAAIAAASQPSIASRTVTQMAGERGPLAVAADGVDVEVIDVPRVAGRPFGPRFGTLVHTTLATVPLDADEATVRRVAATQGRILLGSGDGVDAEVCAVAEAVLAVLRHPMFDRVREADARRECERELPILWQAPDGSLVEGTIDLAFDEGEPARLVVLDFKTDRELEADFERYRRQLAIYCTALAALRGQPARGILMRV
jgi:hypothetical protein